jgi:8-oxo-dGTP pyrophosphatase MutT (NUDIX family)
MASILRIAKDDTVILFRMTLRREAFGPPGGVIKYYSDACTSLDRLQFVPERPGNEPHSFLASDLRGRLPARNLLRFRRWFFRAADRETGEQALRREIAEELGIAGVQDVIDIGALSFRHVRRVEDGPKRVVGESFIQYRLFEVYELRRDSPPNQQLCELLFERAQASDQIIACSYEDLARGRTVAGEIVASHSEAFATDRIRRPDQPLYRA